MATKLPPSWFKTTGSLASLWRLMGWQVPGLTPKLKHGDFVFFAAYALARLVPPLSSFLTLLEYYRHQLQHLSPNSIALVAIFVHLYEMFMGVLPSVRLFQRFFILKATSQRPPLISGYYFQRRTQGHAHFPRQVGALERRLGAGASGRPRPACTSYRHWSRVSTPYWIGSSTWPRTV
jgi:hypothetical protein